MKLYRILGASSKVKTFEKIESALANYATTLSNGVKIKGFSGVGKELKFNGLGVLEAEKALKKGDLSSLNKIFEFDGVISPQVKSVINNEVKNLPSYKVGQVEGKVSSLKSNKIPQELTIPGKDLSVDEVLKTGNGNSLINYLKGKSFKSITLGTIVFGTSAVAIVAIINKHRSEMSGCFKYSVINGLLTSCKVIECSCKDGVINTTSSISTCAAPENMKGGDCSKTSGYSCVNCPSPIVEDELRGDLDNLESLNQDETIYYQCNDPSFIDAVGDIINDKMDDLGNILNVLNETGKGFLGWFTRNIKYIGIGIIIAILAIIAAMAYSVIRKVAPPISKDPPT